MAEDLDYVPMPDKVVSAIKKTWATQIKDADGKPLSPQCRTDVGIGKGADSAPSPYPPAKKPACGRLRGAA